MQELIEQYLFNLVLENYTKKTEPPSCQFRSYNFMYCGMPKFTVDGQ